MSRQGSYGRILERIFFARYSEGVREVPFEIEDLVRAAESLGLERPRNVPDIPYSMRYRGNAPESLLATEPEEESWIIRGRGRGRYSFVLAPRFEITPNKMLSETKIPDATPGIVSKYALGDEQSLLAKLRYNRLIDVFTGVACYPLQSHLRSYVPQMGQVETDDIYVGVDRRGSHYVFPVQAKGGRDKQGVVQIEQDFALCADKFPSLICRPIGAQFMEEDLIALFEFEESESGITLSSEKHYGLVPPDEVTDEDLEMCQRRGPDA
ncbi:MAG: endonuclease [Rubrobacteraceae bacterium]